MMRLGRDLKYVQRKRGYVGGRAIHRQFLDHRQEWIKAPRGLFQEVAIRRLTEIIVVEEEDGHCRPEMHLNTRRCRPSKISPSPAFHQPLGQLFSQADGYGVVEGPAIEVDLVAAT